MYVKANANDIPTVISCLEKDVVRCVYSYIDIVKYGLDNKNLDVWVDYDDAKFVKSIVLRYYNGLNIYSSSDELNVDRTLELIFSLNADLINGPLDTMEKLGSGMKDQYKKHKGYIFSTKQSGLHTGDYGVQEAEKKDFYEIAKLICSDEGIGGHYEVNQLMQQLIDRKDDGFGRNFIIKEGDKIVSHAATYAECREIAVCSGVVTLPEYRGQGYARAVVGKLNDEILQEGKKLFLFVYDEDVLSFYKNMGIVNEQEVVQWCKMSKT